MVSSTNKSKTSTTLSKVIAELPLRTTKLNWRVARYLLACCSVTTWTWELETEGGVVSTLWSETPKFDLPVSSSSLSWWLWKSSSSSLYYSYCLFVLWVSVLLVCFCLIVCLNCFVLFLICWWWYLLHYCHNWLASVKSRNPVVQEF